MTDLAPTYATSMLTPTPKTIHLNDDTLVKATLAVSRNPQAAGSSAPLELDGDDLELLSVALDGKPLDNSAYTLDAKHLTIPGVPVRFTLETVARVRPKQNSKLMGLFASKDGFFSQCEAEGFRRITFFPDRPDVMARYTTTIRADRAEYPWLLSNGNLVAQGDEAHLTPTLSSASGGEGGKLQRQGSRHWARWVDPFPKPSYLFAMVAARLDRLEDSFVTRSGRKV